MLVSRICMSSRHYWQHIRVSPVLYLESVSHVLMACENGNHLACRAVSDMLCDCCKTGTWSEKGRNVGTQQSFSRDIASGPSYSITHACTGLAENLQHQEDEQIPPTSSAEGAAAAASGAGAPAGGSTSCLGSLPWRFCAALCPLQGCCNGPCWPRCAAFPCHLGLQPRVRPTCSPIHFHHHLHCILPCQRASFGLSNFQTIVWDMSR